MDSKTRCVSICDSPHAEIPSGAVSSGMIRVVSALMPLGSFTLVITRHLKNSNADHILGVTDQEIFWANDRWDLGSSFNRVALLAQPSQVAKPS